jgi:hypothetical protein
MSTERGTIINELKFLLENPIYGLGLTSVTKHIELIQIREENFPSFPLGHIMDMYETVKYLPTRKIESRILPVVRLFYQSADYDSLDEIISKIKIALASNNGFPLGSTPKYTRLLSIRTIKEPNHVFVELRVEIEVVFVYTDGIP